MQVSDLDVAGTVVFENIVTRFRCRLDVVPFARRIGMTCAVEGVRKVLEVLTTDIEIVVALFALSALAPQTDVQQDCNDDQR